MDSTILPAWPVAVPDDTVRSPDAPLAASPVARVSVPVALAESSEAIVTATPSTATLPAVPLAAVPALMLTEPPVCEAAVAAPAFRTSSAPLLPPLASPAMTDTAPTAPARSALRMVTPESPITLTAPVVVVSVSAASAFTAIVDAEVSVIAPVDSYVEVEALDRLMTPLEVTWMRVLPAPSLMRTSPSVDVPSPGCNTTAPSADDPSPPMMDTAPPVDVPPVAAPPVTTTWPPVWEDPVV